MAVKNLLSEILYLENVTLASLADSHRNSKNANRRTDEQCDSTFSWECIIKMIARSDNVAFIVVIRVLLNDNARRAPQVTGNCGEQERARAWEWATEWERERGRWLSLDCLSTCCVQSSVSIAVAPLNLSDRLWAQSTNTSRVKRTSRRSCRESRYSRVCVCVSVCVHVCETYTCISEEIAGLRFVYFYLWALKAFFLCWYHI